MPFQPANKRTPINIWKKSVFIGVYLWRRRWDSNPRYVAVQLISSQPRYDHFDTSPYGITGGSGKNGPSLPGIPAAGCLTLQ